MRSLMDWSRTRVGSSEVQNGWNGGHCEYNSSGESSPEGQMHSTKTRAVP